MLTGEIDIVPPTLTCGRGRCSVVDKAASGSGALKNEAVFASVIAAEDFQLFKSVMSKKNIELEMQVGAGADRRALACHLG